MVGWVQKVSNLILNINIAVYDVASGRRLAGFSVDIRGDTDESLGARTVVAAAQPHTRHRRAIMDQLPGRPVAQPSRSACQFM